MTWRTAITTDNHNRVSELKKRFFGLPGRIVIVSGPSAGAGKGKVIRDLLELGDEPPMWLSVSTTTRQPRSDDVIHHTYNFVSVEEFERLEVEGKFLEANGVTEGNRYGTPLEPIVEHLSRGDTVLLEIEVKGAHFVRSVVPEALCIFIKPSYGKLDDDLVELRRRLAGRGTSDADSTERRITQAEQELQMARDLGFYDAWVVNAAGRSQEAAKRILSLMHQRRKTSAEA